MEIKNGKKPLAAKPTTPKGRIAMDDIFGNLLNVSKELADHLTQKGLAYRWVGYKKLVENGGQHERGWEAVKRADCDNIGASSFSGKDPDGYYRRGDLVLAVRTMELHNRHSAYLRQEAERSSLVQSKHANELRQMAKATGLEKSISFSEGYGDADSGE